MRFWLLNITSLKVKQGHFELAILVLHTFSSFLLRLKVFRSITFKYLYDSNTDYSDAAV